MVRSGCQTTKRTLEKVHKQQFLQCIRVLMNTCLRQLSLLNDIMWLFLSRSKTCSFFDPWRQKRSEPLTLHQFGCSQSECSSHHVSCVQLLGALHHYCEHGSRSCVRTNKETSTLQSTSIVHVSEVKTESGGTTAPIFTYSRCGETRPAGLRELFVPWLTLDMHCVSSTLV